MGKEGKYDLQLAGPPPIPDTSDEDENVKGLFHEFWDNMIFAYVALSYVYSLRFITYDFLRFSSPGACDLHKDNTEI